MELTMPKNYSVISEEDTSEIYGGQVNITIPISPGTNLDISYSNKSAAETAIKTIYGAVSGFITGGPVIAVAKGIASFSVATEKAVLINQDSSAHISICGIKFY